MFSKKPLKELLHWEMCQERHGMIGSGTVQVQRDISSIYITIVVNVSYRVAIWVGWVFIPLWNSQKPTATWPFAYER